MKVKAQILQCFFLPFFGYYYYCLVLFLCLDGRHSQTKAEESATFVHFGAKIASEINQTVCVCWPCCVGHPKHTNTSAQQNPARTQRAMEESWSSTVEFEFAAQILCERKYFYLVNVIYYLCLFEHLSSAA